MALRLSQYNLSSYEEIEPTKEPTVFFIRKVNCAHAIDRVLGDVHFTELSSALGYCVGATWRI